MLIHQPADCDLCEIYLGQQRPCDLCAAWGWNDDGHCATAMLEEGYCEPTGEVADCGGSDEQLVEEMWLVNQNYQGDYETVYGYVAVPEQKLPAEFDRVELAAPADIGQAVVTCLGVPQENLDSQLTAWSDAGINWFSGDFRTASFVDHGWFGDWYRIVKDTTGYESVLSPCWFEVRIPNGRVVLLQAASEW
jgi:hypothetical protein